MLTKYGVIEQERLDVVKEQDLPEWAKLVRAQHGTQPADTTEKKPQPPQDNDTEEGTAEKK